MSRASLLAFFDEIRKQDGTFLVHDDGYRLTRRSYRELGAASDLLAHRFANAGVQPGHKVVLYAENRPEWVAALWAILRLGAVAVPVDYRSSREFVERVVAITRPKLLLHGFETEGSPSVVSWNLAEIEWSTGVAGPPAVHRDLAEILFTSGATAEPKGVTITHRNILANLEPVETEIRKYLRYEKPFHPVRFLNLLPLSHMFGQSMAAFIPAVLGGEVYLRSGMDPRDVAGLVHSQRISVLISVPRILEVLREYVTALYPETRDVLPAGTSWLRRWWHYRRVHRLFGWKFWAFITGAAPLPPELEEFWRGLGYVVIQGYGLTETAPIVTLNHPFHTKKGTVGKPIGGVEIKIAEDGEVLVKGANVTEGYFDAAEGDVLDGGRTIVDGWLHTDDIGELDPDGGLRILGRKKEMIVTPEGLNVFPEDVERVLLGTGLVREAAVVGRRENDRETVHAVLIGDEPEEAVRAANRVLEAHQRIRDFSVWPHSELPRTEGTRKIRRIEIRRWVEGEAKPTPPSSARGIAAVLARYAGSREIRPDMSIDELGLSSLDRVQLLTELEQRSGVTVDESALQSLRTVAELEALASRPAAPQARFEFARWNRRWWARAIRRVSLPTWILPIGRLFAWVRVEGLEHLTNLKGPVIFAANHQSHFDVPVILRALPSRWRYNVSPAMSKEFFAAYFHPEGRTFPERFRAWRLYALSALFFNAFPLPQREAGARDTLRYIGELASAGTSILIFPEGKRTDKGEIYPFQPGVGMIAAKVGLPVVPVRLAGLEKILHKDARMAVPGRATVRFGAPLSLQGDDYALLARQVEEAVREMGYTK
jgi:long-chain acyl-CoA synthetase